MEKVTQAINELAHEMTDNAHIKLRNAVIGAMANSEDAVIKRGYLREDACSVFREVRSKKGDAEQKVYGSKGEAVEIMADHDEVLIVRKRTEIPGQYYYFPVSTKIVAIQ